MNLECENREKTCEGRSAKTLGHQTWNMEKEPGQVSIGQRPSRE